MAIKLKVLLPDGSVKKYPGESRRNIADGNLSVVDGTGEEIANFPKGSWTAVGRMTVAADPTDE